MQGTTSSDRLPIPPVHGLSTVQPRAVSQPPRSARPIARLPFNSLSPTLVRHSDACRVRAASAAAAECNVTRAAASRRIAEARKAEGNAAYARGERLAAMERYSLALFSASQAQAHLLGAWEPATQRLRAVVSANLAAASLMPGPVVNGPLPGMGMDPMRALEGGMMAETEDPTYAKGYVRGWAIVTQVCSPAVAGRYIRQAAALEKLGNKPEAVRAIRRALARPELKNDRGLLARLTELLADGRSPHTEAKPDY
jgi:tetratricopeptide (TPR) repeat protein